MASILPLALSQSPPQRNPNCWSNLPLDLMSMVFERLGFTDFERAKSVCSSWHYGSKHSQPDNKIPWMILFPEDKNYCLLFNPQDKGKLYKSRHLGDDFAKSYCMATCRSWLLMRPHNDLYVYGVIQDPIYILNVITGKRINLPVDEIHTGMHSPILWIDEKTKDYLVIGIDGESFEIILSFKKGDNSWKELISWLSTCGRPASDIAYKEHKLYCLTEDKLNVFDYESGETMLKISLQGYTPRVILRNRLPGIPMIMQRIKWNYKIVLTIGGDVLIVSSVWPRCSTKWDIKIYKMMNDNDDEDDEDDEDSDKWVEITSLGDESILLDLGVTVLAKDMEGITRNCIYFNNITLKNTYDEEDIFIYNLNTHKMEKPQQLFTSSVPFSCARWFLPSFKHE